MSKHPDQLVYFLAETCFFSRNFSTAVVNFVGPLTETNRFILEECLRAILKTTAGIVVFNFRDVPNYMDPGIVEFFAKSQKQIREKPAEVKIVALHPDLRKLLLERDAIRPGELANNLAEAFQSFNDVVKGKRAA